VPSLIGRKQCVFQTYGDFVRGQFSAHENNLERLKDHMKHLCNLDKSNAMLLEKMSFMETHFIDVREDLTKRLNEQVTALTDKITRTREEIGQETSEAISALGYGDSERSLVGDLHKKWKSTFEESLRLGELTKTQSSLLESHAHSLQKLSEAKAESETLERVKTSLTKEVKENFAAHHKLFETVIKNK
jgi:uncharacterized phage infection (PIP) family protein YhgE